MKDIFFLKTALVGTYRLGFLILPFASIQAMPLKILIGYSDVRSISVVGLADLWSLACINN